MSLPHICPAGLAGGLDNKLRQWIQNPHTILSPHVCPGMAAMDLGCGPGYFTLEMARLAGPQGRVLAVDLQQGMLDRLTTKLHNTELADRVIPHRCGPTDLKLPSTASLDFILAFYMIHEVPDQDRLFRQLAAALKPGGKLLMVEPFFHVTAREVRDSLKFAKQAGLLVWEGPAMRLQHTTILTRPALPLGKGTGSCYSPGHSN